MNKSRISIGTKKPRSGTMAFFATDFRVFETDAPVFKTDAPVFETDAPVFETSVSSNGKISCKV